MAGSQGDQLLNDVGWYEGEYKDGKYHGQGIYSFSDGIKWMGEWREDTPWNITEYSKNGKVNGKMVNGVQKQLKANLSSPSN